VDEERSLVLNIVISKPSIIMDKRGKDLKDPHLKAIPHDLINVIGWPNQRIGPLQKTVVLSI
jgi:hypothetical protein